MLFIYIGLIAFGAYLIYHEKDLVSFEREILNKIKKAVKK